MKPFINQSRKVKKLKTMRVKNELSYYYREEGLIFSLHGSLDNSQWADICFLSKKYKNIFYNVTIQTNRYTWNEELDNKIYNIVSKTILDENKYSKLDKKVSFSFLCENGKYLYENETILKQKLIQTNNTQDIKVSAFYKLLPMYKFGIGLMMSIDTDTLDYANVTAAILDFLEKGEKNWQDNKLKTYLPY